MQCIRTQCVGWYKCFDWERKCLSAVAVLLSKIVIEFRVHSSDFIHQSSWNNSTIGVWICPSISCPCQGILTKRGKMYPYSVCRQSQSKIYLTQCVWAEPEWDCGGDEAIVIYGFLVVVFCVEHVIFTRIVAPSQSIYVVRAAHDRYTCFEAMCRPSRCVL